ncbi:hypothetical protein ACFQ1T_14375, partial [Methylophilus glucosoxydans]
FNNAGTFVQDASGKQTSINTAFNNSGTVNVKSGTLSLSGGGTSTGSFDIQSGQTLEFAGGTHELTGSTITNAGTLRNSGATTNMQSSSLSGNGAIQVSGGALNINGAVNHTSQAVSVSGGELNFSGTGNLNTGSLDVSGGAFNSAANITTSSVSHTSGTIGGSGSLLTTVLNWFGYGSTQKGNGTTTVSGNATIGDGTNYSYHLLGDGDGTNR